MEPIRLWRWDNRLGVIGATTWHDSAPNGVANEYAALPRAKYDALVKERDVAVREQEAWRLAYVSQARRQEDATARAEKAEALLREARPYVEEAPCPYCDPSDKDCEVRKHWPVLLARIDAHLDGGA